MVGRTHVLSRAIQALYLEHDHVESALVMGERRGQDTTTLWAYHDRLERDIVTLEAQLPQRVVERLKGG